MGTGDFISQVFVEKNDFSNYNVIRTLKFAGIGLFLIVSALVKHLTLVNKFYRVSLVFRDPVYRLGTKHWIATSNILVARVYYYKSLLTNCFSPLPFYQSL